MPRVSESPTRRSHVWRARLSRVSTAFALSQLSEHFPNESTVLPATGRSVTSRAKDEPSNVPGSQVGAHTMATRRMQEEV